MFEYEEVKEDVARDLANEIGALFRYTSAKNASGVDVNKILNKGIISKYFEEVTLP